MVPNGHFPLHYSPPRWDGLIVGAKLCSIYERDNSQFRKKLKIKVHVVRLNKLRCFADLSWQSAYLFYHNLFSWKRRERRVI